MIIGGRSNIVVEIFDGNHCTVEIVSVLILVFEATR